MVLYISMGKHGRNATANPVYSIHERRKDSSKKKLMDGVYNIQSHPSCFSEREGYGEVSMRLGSDAFQVSGRDYVCACFCMYVCMHVCIYECLCSRFFLSPRSPAFSSLTHPFHGLNRICLSSPTYWMSRASYCEASISLSPLVCGNYLCLYV